MSYARGLTRERPRSHPDFEGAVQPLLEEVAAGLGFTRAFVVVGTLLRDAVSTVQGVNAPRPLIDRLGDDSECPRLLLEPLGTDKPLLVSGPDDTGQLSQEAWECCAGAGMPVFAAVPLPSVHAVLYVSREQPLSATDLAGLLPYVSVLATALQTGHEDVRENAGDWLLPMLNAVPDPIVLTDDANGIMLQNRRAEALLRSGDDDSEGKRHAIELNNLLLSTALSSFALDQGASLNRELTLVDPIEGRELLFEVISNPLRDSLTGGRVLVSVLRNLTDLHQAIQDLEQTLRQLQVTGDAVRQERDRLNLILANVTDPILMISPAGEIILTNPPASRLFSAPSEGDHTVQAATPVANETRLTSFLLDLGMDASEVREGPLQLIDPATSEPLYLNVSATKVQDSQGRLSALVCVLHDVTYLRELERRRVEHELHESEKMAAVGRLAAAVAHEINNPLESIKNALYLVAASYPAEASDRKYLDIARGETERVSRIIRQMLGFYRPGLRKEQVNVNAVLEEALTLLSRQLRGQRIAVQKQLTPVPDIQASPDQLTQVFLNLFFNAKEAMGEQGELEVNTRISENSDSGLPAGKYVLVEVRDTGVGIPPDQIEHIFDPFFSSKKDEQGTGLGLWVSRDIVHQHGGCIDALSTPGKGTIFTIALPVS